MKNVLSQTLYCNVHTPHAYYAASTSVVLTADVFHFLIKKVQCSYTACITRIPLATCACGWVGGLEAPASRFRVVWCVAAKLCNCSLKHSFRCYSSYCRIAPSCTRIESNVFKHQAHALQRTVVPGTWCTFVATIHMSAHVVLLNW